MPLGTNRPLKGVVKQPELPVALPPKPQSAVTVAKLHRRLGSVPPQLFPQPEASAATSLEADAVASTEEAKPLEEGTEEAKPLEEDTEESKPLEEDTEEAITDEPKKKRGRPSRA